jgi:hypothetical protein
MIAPTSMRNTPVRTGLRMKMNHFIVIYIHDLSESFA